MGNVLNEEKRQQVLALGRLGWPLRRIQQETGVRRETASAYLKAAGIALRAPGSWGKRLRERKPAKEVSPDSVPGRSATTSACEPYRDFIELSLSKGRNAKAIYQDLVEDHGFTRRYSSVASCTTCRGTQAPEARAVILTPQGQEAQVDYGAGPLVRDPHSGRYRRTRLFVHTLG